MGSEATVVKVTETDVPQLAAVLGRSFQDDPAFSWAAPAPGRARGPGGPPPAAALGPPSPEG